jgi:hypothetical protein
MLNIFGRVNTLTGQESYGGLFEGAPAQFDVILTNPPFGGKEGKDAQTRFDYKTGSTQVLYVQPIINSLKHGGRCGVVVDEGLLFRTNEEAFVKTKGKLVDECNLWYVLSLPGGVSSIEMAQAIKSVGLEPYFVKATNHYLLKATLYAYLRAGIPMMFGFDLVDVSGASPIMIGKHAVAITGYSLGHAQATFFESTNFLLMAARIDKIYVHDDQVGPFSRMVFDNQSIQSQNGNQVHSIQTSWQGNDGTIGGKRAIADILQIPLYHKIRIPFGVIHDIVFGFDSLLKSVISQVIPDLMPIFQQAEWDIYLISVNDLKIEIFDSANLNTDIRRNILMQSFPRFLWRASLIVDGGIKLDLLFDATDIEQGAFFLCAIDHDTELTGLFRILFNMDKIESLFDVSTAWPIVAWFRENS